jgi:sulfite reductase (NADPH) hemoprotein beta-component
MNDQAKVSVVEEVKAASNFLRGSLQQSLRDGATGAIADDDTHLSKFHGVYQQDDRDARDDRRRQMLEPDYQFMIRARVPGGVCTPAQWLAMDEIATRWANGSIRITSRQAFQFHGVLKTRLKSSIRAINDTLLDTLAACGDVNRNVMSTALPESSSIHREVYEMAGALSTHLTPATSAYHEIWLDKKRLTSEPDVEPLYGETYLPRKFKIAFAVPPRNDVDIYANDMGFIAISDEDKVTGYNITVGGGMGATHGDPATYPRLADVLGFCKPEQVLEVAEAIVSIQRDHGDRHERKHARFKYTIDDHGLDWLHDELEKRIGYRLTASRDFKFSHSGDLFGWQQSDDDLWHLGLFIENGRILDDKKASQLSGLREIAKIHTGEFRLTGNQNLVIAGVTNDQRAAIDALVARHQLDGYRQHSPLRLHSIACVAFPTCGLAMAESERYLPDLIGKIESLLATHQLDEQAITIRMTGCPNGCARPYLAEIGLVGKGPGLYNLHLGAAHNGTRLNTLFAEALQEDEILSQLDSLFARYRAERTESEYFGDFLHRAGLVTLPTQTGATT